MAKTNLVKMEVYFDLDTQSFIALDPETGEFRDFSVHNMSRAFGYGLPVRRKNGGLLAAVCYDYLYAA